jgi:hypothetical protein
LLKNNPDIHARIFFSRPFAKCLVKQKVIHLNYPQTF